MSVDEITVTMLGPSGSGKTTFMLGMYAILSGGYEGYFLYADDHDVNVELSERWDALCDDGLLPPLNDETPRPYPMVFNDGLTPLLSIDWWDYRGGAILDNAAKADVAELLERLDRSDSVYLVLDGAKLSDLDIGSSESKRRTRAAHMTTILQQSFKRRRDLGLELPSMVILLTKADLLDGRYPGTHGSAERNHAMLDEIQSLLPVCFEKGAATMVCATSLGDFGIGQTKVQPGTAHARGLHMPMIFSLFCYLKARVVQLGDDVERADREVREADDRLRELEATAFVFFRGSKTREIQGDREYAKQYGKRISEEQKDLERRAGSLLDVLGAMPIVLDGERMVRQQ